MLTHPLLVSGIVLVSCATAFAQHPAAKKPDAPMPPLMEGLGTAEIKITTADPMAQAYFNQGLRLIYAFNHEEAIRAFRAAETIDPDCAMAQWGVAVALGPNYNMEADPEKAEILLTALRKAQQLVQKGTPKEQDYVAAASKRYAGDSKADPKANRKRLDRDYADAMCELAAKYPDDLEAAVLAAESMMQLRPWDLWTADGSTPLPRTEEIVSRLENVIARNPGHTGANHYHIHACEASRQPERALPSARRLGELAPGAGHLIHMPSHIYFRLGMYEDAVKSNQVAVAVDEVYLAKNQPTGAYPMMYYPHNIHFLWAALAMEGRSADSIAAATRIAEKLTPEMAKEMAIVEYFLPVRWYALTRFGKWDEILKEQGPPEELTFAYGIWHYARGKAFAGKGQLAEAASELAALEKSLAATPQDTVLMRHSTPQLLAIAQHDLAADLAARAGATGEAIAQLRVAVLLQDQVLYDEPPPWYCSERVALARVLLGANEPAEAEAVLREDLKRSPNSGWSLCLLEKAVRAQDRAEEADQVQAEFKKTWARADFELR
jgi:tetratricopeptide (TPR) repeat protein